MRRILTIENIWRNEMKKKIGFFMLYCFVQLAVSAQGQPVIDIAHILETIQVASQTYQQVQNTIK